MSILCNLTKWYALFSFLTFISPLIMTFGTPLMSYSTMTKIITCDLPTIVYIFLLTIYINYSRLKDSSCIFISYNYDLN